MFEIYMLSILDNVQALVLFTWILTSTANIYIIIAWIDSECKLGKHFNRIFNWCIIIFIISSILLAVIPTRKSLIESYLMANCKNIVTKENIETIMKKIDDKSGRVIEILSDEWEKHEPKD